MLGCSAGGMTARDGGWDGVARHQRMDENQLFVLQSSAALFADRGYLGTSVNDLVEAAGLTKNAF